jgi:hypothetical protein
MDKLDRISQLQDDNAASLAEIARRQEYRAANPELEETPIIQKFDNEELIYKTTETPLLAPAPAAPAYDDVFMEATAEFVTKYVGKKLAERDFQDECKLAR